MENRGGNSAFQRVLFPRSRREERIRRRWAAGAAAVVFVGGLLAVLGLGLVVLIAVVLSASVASVWIAWRHGADLGDVAARVRATWRHVPRAADADEATVEMAAIAAQDDRTVYGRAPLPTRQQLGDLLPRLRLSIPTKSADALTETPASVSTFPSSVQLEGSRCNTLGVALRRAGRAQQAASLHQAARLIFAGAGDSRGEALTANALGAAFAEVGEHEAALEQFEQARMLLQALGDQEWEGRVLANIAFAKRRVGADEEADDFLRSALQKLSPQTEAYRRVESRLRPAS